MSGATQTPVHFGIAGWSYPDWKGTVYPAGCRDLLQFCARFVDCIEINSTFYRPPDPRLCASWALRTADSPVFFTAKMPQTFTHHHRIDASAVAEVRDGFGPLVETGKLRMLLAQFSYRFTASPRNRDHLTRIADAAAGLAPLAVEVRHKSWEEPEALDAIRGLQASLVHLDYPGAASGFGLRRTEILGGEQIAYLRLHGRNHDAWFRKDAGRDEVYDYDYGAEELRGLTTRIGEVAAGAKETIVIGNNHFHGQGMKVALELLALHRGGKVEVPAELLRTFPELRTIAKGAARGLFD